MDRFQVTGYTDGEWCVIDSETQKVIQFHESIRWKNVFTSRDDAQKLADTLNREIIERPDAVVEWV